MVVGQTKLANMVDPEVMADIISASLAKAIRFTPLAQVNTNLVGRPGSTLTFPAFTYIGDAADIEEGEAIPLDQMATAEKPVTVKKAGKGVEITDEAILSGLGDPLGEANKQLTMAIANKVDNDLLAAAETATQSAPSVVDVATLQAALDVFEDEDDQPAAIVMNPADAALLLTDARAKSLGSEVSANSLMNGTYANVLGVEVVRSNKVEAGKFYLIKQGALALVMKRAAQVEADRDIVKKTTVITADQHYAAYLYDASKVVKSSAV